MNYLPDKIISHLKLFTFYKGIFSVKKLLQEFVGILLHASSFPLTVNLLVTGECNFSCKMCSGKQPEARPELAPASGLDIVELQKFIERIKKYRPLVHIGGGEPFMRNDLMDVLAMIKNNQLKCLISTNGSLINEVDIDKIVKLKIDVLIFSLYGLEATHDIITGVKGSFNRAIMNLERLLEKRTQHTKIFVSTLPLVENINEIKQLIKKLYVLGIDGVKIEQLNFLTRQEYKQEMSAREGPNFDPEIYIRDSYFDREFIIQLTSVYKDLQKTFKKFILIKPYLNKAQVKDWYSAVPRRSPRCFFIAHSVFINYNGEVLPCQFFKARGMGNIRDGYLETIWDSQAYRTFRKSMNSQRSIVCSRCCKN